MQARFLSVNLIISDKTYAHFGNVEVCGNDEMKLLRYQLSQLLTIVSFHLKDS